MAFTSVLKQVGIRQNSKAELVFLSIDTSALSGASNAGILEGAQQAICEKTATGTYVITLNRTGRRDLIVVGASPLTIDARFKIGTITESAVTVIWEVGGTDTDMDFHITLCAFYSEFDR